MEKREITKKVCLLGDAAVGKTSSIRRYVFDQFDDMYIVTFGAKVSKKELTVIEGDDEYRLSLSIWDIVGDHDKRMLQGSHYTSSSGAIVICDCTRRNTFTFLSDWMDAFLLSAPGAKFAFLLNKIDLVDRAQVSLAELQVFAKDYDAVGVWETSAKTGQNIEEAFTALARALVVSGGGD